MEIEDVDKFSSLENDHLVLVVLQGDVLVVVHHHVEGGLHVIHHFVELSESIVVQVLIVFEAPLPSAPVIAPVVAFTWEIDPFWVAELVAHEVEVALASQAEGDKSDHLVKSDTSVYDKRVVTLI